MTIFRNPVPGAPMRPTLKCVNTRTDEVIDAACLGRRKGITGKRFKCPRGCKEGTWLYPRHRRGDGTIHFHQGLDLGGHVGGVKTKDDGSVDVVSVTDGKVVKVQTEDVGTYGRVVVVKDEVRGFHFLYAHLHSVARNIKVGKRVVEQQVLGKVGSSGTARKANPHLHFEISKQRLPTDKGAAHETKPGETPVERVNPFHVLEQLGPWGMSQTHVPTGGEANASLVALTHTMVETTSFGGFFPLGANNIWHGGVHLSTTSGQELVAPFDGKIVALRLDPDAATANQAFGSVNFIVLRHEISEVAFARLTGKTEQPETLRRGVGPDRSNDPEDVKTVKKLLHDRVSAGGTPFYDPADPADLTTDEVDKALKKAIKAFQREVLGHSPPDGKVDIPGASWTELHGGSPPEDPPVDEPTDAHRVVFSLLMHLAPKKVTNKLAAGVPWLSRVKTKTDPDPTDEEDKEHKEDLEEAGSHELTGNVGAGVGEDPDDVIWVKKRLIRFGLYEPQDDEVADDETVTLNGDVTEALQDAIKVFQRDVAGFKKSQDGVVEKGKKTHKALRKPRREHGKAAPEAVDPAFVAKLSERDGAGLAKVVTDLSIPVRSGEVLWFSATAAGFETDDSVAPKQKVHWEIFSEEKIFDDDPSWHELDVDPDSDLVVDAKSGLIDFVEKHDAAGTAFRKDGVVTPAEILQFYASGDANFLRRTQCRFRAEWAIDVPQTVKRLHDLGFDTDKLEDGIDAYQWWALAGDAVPKDPNVWHYNPIEFLGVYQQVLDALQPPPPPKPKDPTTHGTLIVTVLNKHRGTQPEATVALKIVDGGGTMSEQTTKRSHGGGGGGEATFFDVPAGLVQLFVGGASVAPTFFMVEAGTANRVTIETGLEGPGRPNGTLRVTVRKHTGVFINGEVVALMEKGREGIVATDVTKNSGRVVFEELPFGDYIVAAGSADGVEIKLDRKSKGTIVKLPAPKGTLIVEVTADGETMGGVKVVVDKGKTQVASGVTNNAGKAQFELGEAHYKVVAGTKSKTVKVTGGAVKTTKLSLSDDHAPEQGGQLIVEVTRDGAAVPDELVMVLDETDAVAGSERTDADGLADFDLVPGKYLAAAADASATATVGHSIATGVTLQIS